MGFGEIIKRAREDAGLSQDRLGEMVGVSGVSVGYWERGKSLPRGGNAQKLIDVLGIDPIVLLSSDPGIALLTGLDSRKVHDSAPSYTAPLYDAEGASLSTGEAMVLREIPVPQQVFEDHPAGFYLRMVGDSMNRVLPAGLVAYVDPDAEVENGGMAAVEIEGSGPRIVRFNQISNTIVLQPDSSDPAFRDEPHDAGAVTVLGPVVWFGSPYGERL